MKILFIGNVEFSARLLKKLIAIKADIGGIITKEKSPFNADHRDLSMLAKKAGIPYLYADNINAPEVISWVKKIKADAGYCFGFSQLLDKKLLSCFPEGLLGYHPAALPQNRGRHPIVWALALGLENTASTFFCMTQKADAGKIVSQETVRIRYEDDAQSLYNKLSERALHQIEKIYNAGRIKTIKRVPQAKAVANYWRKRSKKDGEIDFRMDSRAIYNLVRALTHPYVGAHLIFKDQEIKVWKVREGKYPARNIECGKILEIKKKHILVKCGNGAVWLTDHEFGKLPSVGEHIL